MLYINNPVLLEMCMSLIFNIIFLQLTLDV